MQNARTVIRKKIREQRNRLTNEEREQCAIRLKHKLVSSPLLQNAQNISVYVADDGEIDPQLWLFWAEEHNKSCYLPCVNLEKGTLLFAKYESTTPIAPNKYGIFEPAIENQKLYQPQELDVILVPLVAFDLTGNRLGRGAGYYDKTFAYLHNASSDKQKPLLIGLAYEFQRVDRIEASETDVKLNAIITDLSNYPINV